MTGGGAGEGGGWELAQVNIARLLEPLDTPRLADFVAALAPINARADAAPGFVWRLQTEAGDATSLRPYDDDLLIMNLSVWASAEALSEFVYRSAHVEVMRQRRRWFERMGESFLALWWVPAGHRPAPLEARGRLEHLQRHGPTAEAFTFRTLHPPPGTVPGGVIDAGVGCPA